MTSPDTFHSPESDLDRTRRREQILQQLRSAADPLLEQMADTLVDAPQSELFGEVEHKARDLGQRIAAAAQQTGLDDRKKGGT